MESTYQIITRILDKSKKLLHPKVQQTNLNERDFNTPQGVTSHEYTPPPPPPPTHTHTQTHTHTHTRAHAPKTYTYTTKFAYFMIYAVNALRPVTFITLSYNVGLSSGTTHLATRPFQPIIVSFSPKGTKFYEKAPNYINICFPYVMTQSLQFSHV